MLMPDDLIPFFIEVMSTATPLSSYVFERGLLCEWSDNPLIVTAAASHRGLHFNEKFMNSLDLRQAGGVFCHEIVHHLMGHPEWLRVRSRMGTAAGRPFIPALAQISLDCLVNDLVSRFGGVLPADCCADKDVSVWKHSEDDAYRILYDKYHPPSLPPGGRRGRGSGSGSGRPEQPRPGNIPGQGRGDVDDSQMPDCTDEQYRHEEAKRQGHMIHVLEEAASRMQGDGRGLIDGLLNRLRRSNVDWRLIITQLWRATTGADERTWTRPKGWGLSQRLYIPGRRGRRAGHVVSVIDTSGSVGKSELELFMGAQCEIAEFAMPHRLDLVQLDAAIQDHRVITEIGELRRYAEQLQTAAPEIAVKGRGGTDMRLAFKWLRDQELEPDLIFVFTDGETPYPDGFAPAKRAVWCLTNDYPVPPEAGERLLIRDDR